ncbi:hypothetical protein KUV62_03375 [Salipiger bermudensis]|uniref:hypothetical protein n=1 Tax=Salipiger bermudensis TaxID=344736 RepID=UPI001C992D13|nr:hypothetical protein [Salipiger bermudensis]MBY6002931.1 hypothetical protein [Salipiger bermudensis]
MTPTDGPAPAPSFLVAVTDQLVGIDIATILRDAHPDAVVVTAPDREAALISVRGGAAPSIAVVSLSPEEARSSALGQALLEIGTRIVLMGHEAELHGEADGFEVLHRPFRTVDLLALLGR